MKSQDLSNSFPLGKQISEQQISRWRENAALLATFEAIGRDGVTAVVKIDGGRPDGVFTVLVSGTKLGGLFFRKDGDDLELLLRAAVDFYRSEVWSK